MPRPHPKEFREDVVAAARRADAPIKQIAKDFGISESCLRNWLQRPGSPAHDDLVRRDFTAARPNERRPMHRASGCLTAPLQSGQTDRARAQQPAKATRPRSRSWFRVRVAVERAH